MNNRVKISELPYILAIDTTPQDVLHIIKYPEKQGRKITLGELSSYFVSSSVTGSYALNSKNAESSSYIKWENIDNVPNTLQYWYFPFPSSSNSSGSEGRESYNRKYYALYTSGSWRRSLIALFGDIPLPTSSYFVGIPESSISDGMTYNKSYSTDFLYFNSSSIWYRIPLSVFSSSANPVGQNSQWEFPNIPYINIGTKVTTPISSFSSGNEGDESYDDEYYYLYSFGLWRRCLLTLFSNQIFSLF